MYNIWCISLIWYIWLFLWWTCLLSTTFLFWSFWCCYTHTIYIHVYISILILILIPCDMIYVYINTSTDICLQFLVDHGLMLHILNIHIHLKYILLVLMVSMMMSVVVPPIYFRNVCIYMINIHPQHHIQMVFKSTHTIPDTSDYNFPLTRRENSWGFLEVLGT